MTPKDWTAVLKYAALVRRIIWPQGDRYSGLRLQAAVWDTMCLLRPTAVLFPQLRSLRWATLHLPEKYLASFLICAGTNLARIYLQGFSYYGADASATLRASMGILAERFPGLHEVDVSSGVVAPALILRGNQVDTNELGHTLCTLAGSFTSLVSFSSRDLPVTADAMLSFTQLKTLRSLTVRLADDAPGPSEQPAPCVDTRIALQTIDVELLATAQAYITFSTTISLPQATSFTLVLTQSPPADLIPALFSSIRMQCSPDALRDLDIQEPGVKTLRAVAGLILPIHLRPLLEFKQLDYLVILIACRYALDDALYVDMANAWPRIKSLYVGCQDLYSHEALPSVRVLPLLAVLCPELESLGLAFDAIHWQDEKTFDTDWRGKTTDVYGPLANRASTSVLRTLMVGQSPICAPEYIAAFLLRVFPNLCSIIRQPLVSPTWNDARRFLRLFKTIGAHLVTQKLAMMEGAEGKAGHGLDVAITH